MGYFVKPKSVRIPISNGQFIDVKSRLNTGETHGYFSRIAPEVIAGEKPKVDTEAVMTARVVAYLIGWSLTDDDGTPVPMNPDMPERDRLAMLNNLEVDVFNEIKAAIDAHDEAADAQRTAEKNAPATASVSSATSTSAVI